VSVVGPPPRVNAERFERHYEASADPWNYRDSAYEREKYAATLAALPPRRFDRALELGCSIGVFSGLLAERCERLVAIDFSARAVALARERLAEKDNIEVVQASFPEQVPAGDWELIVCSEVLYYLDEPALVAAIEWLQAQLRSGAAVLAVSWRGRGLEEPLLGDEVHDLLAAKLARWHALDARHPGYRLDRFEDDGR
jgi:SAM-dependent methyltransferase